MEELMDLKADLTLDAKGLSCPMPLLKTKQFIGKIKLGEVLEVLGTDPGSKNDLPGWCERSGHEFLGAEDGGGFFKFYIRRGK